ncbi:MAG TPA: 1,4-alpha-glucan branching enzyme, partial [Pedococcus sp.]|nr:1,4-alpha-glucan branching enzyme [Pedococcus sp.]
MSPKFGKKSRVARHEAQAPEPVPEATTEAVVADATTEAVVPDATTEAAVPDAVPEQQKSETPAESGGSSWFGLPDAAEEPAGESLPPVDVAATTAVSAPEAHASATEQQVDREPPVDREPEPVPVITTPQEAIRALADGRHQQPHDLLGHHLEPQGLVVRAYRPFASSVAVIFQDGERIELQHESEGVWGGVRAGATQTQDYRLRVAYADGIEHQQDDPYRFAPTLGPIDLHLIGEGRHEELWTVLGAHVREYPGPMGTVVGTSFAVWAPRAQAVHVAGDFNGWDTRAHSMRLLGESGVWELFIPGVGDGTLYKFLVRGA